MAGTLGGRFPEPRIRDLQLLAKQGWSGRLDVARRELGSRGDEADAIGSQDVGA